MTSAISAFVKRSLQGVRVDSERLREIDPDKIHFQDVIALFIRAWPYIYPMRWHAVTYVGLAVFNFLWETFFTFVIFGLIYNNIILDLPVSSIGAAMLFLDPAQWVEIENLTKGQRYEIVLGVIALAIIATAMGESIGHGNHYYRVWILQNINQNLRLHLMRQLQSLSLKFHAESKTGDAI